MLRKFVTLTISKAVCQRQIHSTVVIGAKGSDPIQAMFLDRIHEYSKQAKSAESGLVGASPDVVKSLQDALERIERTFDAKSQDMTLFPQLKTEDKPLMEPRCLTPPGEPDPKRFELQEDEDYGDDIRYV